MNINIRKSIINNFKDANYNDIVDSINEAINDKEEITLPGLGVFFEILWQNLDNDNKEFIVKTIMNSLQKKED